MSLAMTYFRAAAEAKTPKERDELAAKAVEARQASAKQPEGGE